MTEQPSMSTPSPLSIRAQSLPAPANPFQSPPNDWQDQVIYFLLPDRFSDGRELTRPLLDRSNKQSARALSWRSWANSGKNRWQGGQISGITSKIHYLKKLGITVVWVGPV